MCEALPHSSLFIHLSSPSTLILTFLAVDPCHGIALTLNKSSIHLINCLVFQEKVLSAYSVLDSEYRAVNNRGVNPAQ